jgi:hypothetical protein
MKEDSVAPWLFLAPAPFGAGLPAAPVYTNKQPMLLP